MFDFHGDGTTLGWWLSPARCFASRIRRESVSEVNRFDGRERVEPVHLDRREFEVTQLIVVHEQQDEASVAGAFQDDAVAQLGFVALLVLEMDGWAGAAVAAPPGVRLRNLSEPAPASVGRDLPRCVDGVAALDHDGEDRLLAVGEQSRHPGEGTRSAAQSRRSRPRPRGDQSSRCPHMVSVRQSRSVSGVAAITVGRSSMSTTAPHCSFMASPVRRKPLLQAVTCGR